MRLNKKIIDYRNVNENLTERMIINMASKETFSRVECQYPVCMCVRVCVCVCVRVYVCARSKPNVT